MVYPDLSAVFRNDFPEAQAVTVNVGGKNYPMVEGCKVNLKVGQDGTLIQFVHPE